MAPQYFRNALLSKDYPAGRTKKEETATTSGMGKVEGEKSILKQSEEQLGEGQEGGTAVRSRRILQTRSARHLIADICVPTGHLLLFHLRNSACSCAKYYEVWGLEGSYHKKSTWNLSMAHFALHFSDRKSWFDSPLPTSLCAKAHSSLGWELTCKSPKKKKKLQLNHRHREHS